MPTIDGRGRGLERERDEEKTVVEESVEVTVGGYCFTFSLSLTVEPRLSCQLLVMFGEPR